MKIKLNNSNYELQYVINNENSLDTYSDEQIKKLLNLQVFNYFSDSYRNYITNEYNFNTLKESFESKLKSKNWNYPLNETTLVKLNNNIQLIGNFTLIQVPLNTLNTIDTFNEEDCKQYTTYSDGNPFDSRKGYILHGVYCNNITQSPKESLISHINLINWQVPLNETIIKKTIYQHILEIYNHTKICVNYYEITKIISVRIINNEAHICSEINRSKTIHIFYENEFSNFISFIHSLTNYKYE